MAIRSEMVERAMLNGNYAAAYGAKLCRVEVVPAFPITPQTTVMEKLSEFISLGELDAEFIAGESEHSVMAAAIASEATGARTFTATSSQGLLYMHELLFAASGLRLPIVMAVANRCLAAPVSICSDQCDSLAQRDTSWIQLYAESAQEVMDMVIQSFKIAEDERVLLPAAVCYEGFSISHSLEPVTMPSQEYVDRYLSPYEPQHVVLDPERVMHLSIVGNDAYYTEYRYQQEEAMENARKVIGEVDESFGDIFGRRYGGLIGTFMMDDAEIALLTMGSLSGAAREVVRRLRKEGVKAGLIRVRAFRPFPFEEIARATGDLSLLITFDKNASFGMGGIVSAEVAASLYNLKKRPLLVNYIIGLGGRDTTVDSMMELVKKALPALDRGMVREQVQWGDVRGVNIGENI